MPGTDLVTAYLHPAEYRANLQYAASRQPIVVPDHSGPGHLPGMPPGRFASAGAGGGGGPAPGGGSAPGGTAQMHLAQAAERGKEIGEPTSFNAGAGAPAPIAVMRGNTTTYNSGLPGRQFSDAEYATPLQAQQAYNRGMLQKNLGDIAARSDRERLTRPGLVEAAQARYGDYRAPGQTVAEITASKANQDPEKIGKGELYGAMAREKDAALTGGEGKTNEKQGVASFQRLMSESPYSTYKDGKMTFTPKDENQARDAMAAENIARAQGGEAGFKHFEERQEARNYLQTQPLPRGFDANAFLAKASSDPDIWKALMAKVTTAAQKQQEPKKTGFFTDTDAGQNLSAGSGVSGLGHLPSFKEFGEQLAVPFE